MYVELSCMRQIALVYVLAECNACTISCVHVLYNTISLYQTIMQGLKNHMESSDAACAFLVEKLDHAEVMV